MTKREKFKEVFGFDLGVEKITDKCVSYEFNCDKCPFECNDKYKTRCKDFWDEEYNPSNENNLLWEMMEEINSLPCTLIKQDGEEKIYADVSLVLGVLGKRIQGENDGKKAD